MIRTVRFKLAGWTVVIAAAVAVYFLFNPLKAGFFPRCPFYVLTGLYCPGCGSQRAFHALLHGHLLTAAHDNLLSVLALPLLGYSAASFTLNQLAGTHFSQGLFYRPWFAKATLLTVLAFWLLRNLPFPCFRWLAP